MNNKRKIFICVFAAAVLINIIPLLIFKDKAAITPRSIFPAFFVICLSISGVVSYLTRHKGDKYRRLHLWMLLLKDEEYTFTEEYEKSFFVGFCIYWFAIPFYLPFVFFDLGWNGSILWPLCVMFVTLLVSIACEMPNMIKEAKERRTAREKLKVELKEQELREEMGHIK